MTAGYFDGFVAIPGLVEVTTFDVIDVINRPAR